MVTLSALSFGLVAAQLFSVVLAAPKDTDKEVINSLNNDSSFNLTARRQYIVPFTSPTITLVLTQGPALKLSQPERAFQTLVEAVARLSDHDQAQQLPPDAFTLAYGDCIVGVANPAGLEAMSYGAAVSSFRGLGEFMLENSEWKNEQEVRISIDDDIVGTMLIKNNPGSGSAETM